MSLKQREFWIYHAKTRVKKAIKERAQAHEDFMWWSDRQNKAMHDANLAKLAMYSEGLDLEANSGRSSDMEAEDDEDDAEDSEDNIEEAEASEFSNAESDGESQITSENEESDDVSAFEPISDSEVEDIHKRAVASSESEDDLAPITKSKVAGRSRGTKRTYAESVDSDASWGSHSKKVVTKKAKAKAEGKDKGKAGPKARNHRAMSKTKLKHRFGPRKGVPRDLKKVVTKKAKIGGGVRKGRSKHKAGAKKSRSNTK
ncbi:uncharacterized protein PAC_04975 [Phialocephala subalpina]|uniref:Uncharacterized protein n=1 Tax=Phialocephala subalpina TaxID=576137 RepID=A0A1L7WQP5_9HELO|nr:uncharacterized protein PAC_04975 [Phialocephala subalpina]